MNTTDVEVDHLSDWGAGEWWLHLLGAALIPVLIAGLAVAGLALVLFIFDRVSLPDLVELGLTLILGAAAAVGAALGLIWYGQSLYEVLRHATSWNRSFLWALLVAAVLIAAALYIADRFDVAEWPVVVAASVALGLPALVAWAVDALHRVAAWIPMAFGAFMCLLVVGILVVIVKALE